MIALVKQPYISSTSPYGLYHGDCLEIMREMAENSIDAICTDPPAGIAFMNKSWDTDKGGRDAWIAWLTEVMREALRVIKPGGHAFVWALPRTSHWTATALENSGWTIRDIVVHLNGAGFPKSLNLGNGQGTALKPSNEHWILCRKPLAESTIAKNVLTWGTGGLAIDASRIGNDTNRGNRYNGKVPGSKGGMFFDGGTGKPWNVPQGRFPSNTLMSHTLMCVERGVKRVRVNDKAHDRHNGARIDRTIYGDYDANITTGYADEDGMEQVSAWECVPECPIYQLDCQSGMRKSGGRIQHKGDRNVIGVTYGSPYRAKDSYMEPSEGTASRYFQQFHPTEEDIVPYIYCSKASRTERNQGCEGLPEAYNDFQRESSGLNQDRPNREGRKPMDPQSNHHPTVKPLQLMRYLITMITPPDGIVLDPFAGSGSTLVACVQTGHRFIGIEQDESYVTIARSRIAHAEREVQVEGVGEI